MEFCFICLKYFNKSFLKFFVKVCVNKNVYYCVCVYYINGNFSDCRWYFRYFKCFDKINYCDR